MLAPMVAVRGINRYLGPQPGHLSIELHLLPRHFRWSAIVIGSVCSLAA